MLRRRIIEHVKSQNWVAIAIDFAIVVLGVFIGLQASNWNSERLAHEAGETYRARIVRDIQNNEADLRGRSAYLGQIKAFALQVLGDLDGTVRITDEQFLIAAYQATQIYTRPLSRSTYDEVLSTGGLNTLGDVSTRDRIADYYIGVAAAEASFTPVTGYRDLVRSAIPYHVQERIRTACAEVLYTVGDAGLGRLVLPEHCTLGLNEGELSRAAARVRNTPGLELAVTRLLADLDQKLIQVARSERRARDLTRALSALR